MEGKELSYYPSCVIISNKLNETSNENVYFTEDEFESSPIIPTTLPTNPLYCLDTLRTTSPPTYSDLKLIYDETSPSSQASSYFFF